VTSAPYAVAVRADDRSLLRAIDDALERMAAENTLETILGRFF
jgi:ABC-type amino acid transport substrate-binding protein